MAVPPKHGQTENALLGKASAQDRVFYEQARRLYDTARRAEEEAEQYVNGINNKALREFAEKYLES